MNTVVLIGRSTKEPEMRYLPNSGRAVTNFSLAVDRDFKNKDGERQTDFFNIVVWGKTAEYCANYLRKGKLVAVRGRIENRSYQNKEGETRYITEIIAEQLQILEWPDRSNNESSMNAYQHNNQNSSQANQSQNQDTSQNKALTDDDFQVLDEADLPF